MNDPNSIVKCACGLPMRLREWENHWRTCYVASPVPATEQDIRGLEAYEQRRKERGVRAYSRQHEAAERVALRRWLRKHDIEPVMGNEPSHTDRLMKQVLKAGGDPHTLMAEACAKVDESKEGR